MVTEIAIFTAVPGKEDELGHRILRGIEVINSFTLEGDGATHDTSFVDVEEAGNSAKDGGFACTVSSKQGYYCLIWYL